MSVLRGFVIISLGKSEKHSISKLVDCIVHAVEHICNGRIILCEHFVQNGVLGFALMNFSNHGSNSKYAAHEIVLYLEKEFSHLQFFCQIIIDEDGERSLYETDNLIENVNDLSDSFA